MTEMMMMPRATQRRWHAATTLRDLGELTALWLEGQIDSQPGYQPGFGPDEETTDLIPVLARLNRIGYLTDCSQPGRDPGAGYDGATWCQRAAVSGFAEPAVADAIAATASAAGVLVYTAAVSRWDHLGDRIPVTTRAGRPCTAFGGRRSRRGLKFQYEDCSDAAVNAVLGAVQLTIVDPEWGQRDTLWTLLDGIITAVTSTEVAVEGQ